MNTQIKHLLLLQTGPVQDFITAARTTGDLWSGSYFIAYLTAAGIKYVQEHGGTIIFPCLENQTVYKRICGETSELGQPTLPNRFLAEVPADKAREIAAGAEMAIREELLKISKVCFKEFCEIFTETGLKYQNRWDSQVERFLQISWQTVPLDTDNWGQSYKNLLSSLAARRNTRNFVQYDNDEVVTELQKDALNGKDEIVGDVNEWKKACQKFNVNGDQSTCDKPYGALSVIKRLWGECYLKQHIAAENYSAFKMKEKSSGEAAEYIAAIQMDGDHMGSILSSQDKDKAFFTRFSKKLANFTRQEAENIVKRNEGKLIYAGGDDVLAILPACNAVKCARELREKFCEDSPDMPGSEKNLSKEVSRVSLSAGIAFAHWKTPLAWLLEEARAAEHRAKNDYQRDALSLSIVKRGGEILQWGAKFDSPAWNMFDCFTNLKADKKVSGKFASALGLLLKQYHLEELDDDRENLNNDLEIISRIIKADFSTVCARQACCKQGEGKDCLPSEFFEFANAYIDNLKEERKLADFPNLFLSASFLTRNKEEKKGE